jgi:hypothetical protein
MFETRKYDLESEKQDFLTKEQIHEFNSKDKFVPSYLLTNEEQDEVRGEE